MWEFLGWFVVVAIALVVAVTVLAVVSIIVASAVGEMRKLVRKGDTSSHVFSGKGQS